MYNQALILLDKHKPFKAEKLLKNIVEEYMDTSVATEAIRTLQMMESFRIIEKSCNATANDNLCILMTAMGDYYKDHKRYPTSINELEKYGFYIFDGGVSVLILSANNKSYVARAVHKRGDKIYIVKRPTDMHSISEIEKDFSSTLKKKETELDQYNRALAYYRNEQYKEAMGVFKSYAWLYPKSKLADNAYFWIGECYRSLTRYGEAIFAYQKIINDYPKGNKVPAAMLQQALTFERIHDKTAAILVYKRLINNFPETKEAQIARKRLSYINRS